MFIQDHKQGQPSPLSTQHEGDSDLVRKDLSGKQTPVCPLLSRLRGTDPEAVLCALQAIWNSSSEASRVYDLLLQQAALLMLHVAGMMLLLVIRSRMCRSCIGYDEARCGTNYLA